MGGGGRGDLPSLEIPAIRELASRRQWVCWRVEPRRGKETKVPVTPEGRNASASNPRTWSSFEECCAAVTKNPGLAGVGFVLSHEDPYIGIDLDACVNGTGALVPWAQQAVDELASYTEWSPSGRGVHVWCRGHMPATGRRRGGIEVYATARYLTVSGRVFSETVESIEERSEAVARLLEREIGEGPSPVSVSVEGIRLDPQGSPPGEKLSALLQNDRRFKASWEHRRTDLADGSLSSFDLSLATIAAYAEWTDQEIADLIITHRRAFQDVQKALRPDYIQRTLARARAAAQRGATDSDATDEARVQEAEGAGEREAYAELSARIGVSVDAVIQRGEDPAFYYLRVGGEEIRLGTASQLLSQASVRAAVLGKTRQVMPRVKAPQWDRAVSMMLRLAEYEDLGEGQYAEETRTWVREYLAEHPPIVPEGTDELAKRMSEREPFRQECRIHLMPRAISQWLWVHWGERIPHRTLCSRLREIGLAPSTVQIWAGGKNHSTRTWSFPEGENNPAGGLH